MRNWWKRSLLSVAVLATAALLLMAGAYFKAESASQYNALTDFDYSVSGEKITILGYTGTGAELRIAPTYEVTGIRCTVTAIGETAFEACEQLTYVELPDTLEQVGEYAFYDCLNLKTVVVKGADTEVSAGAFGFYYISRKEDGIVAGFVLEGHTDSPAEIYAKENGLTFRVFSEKLVSNGNAEYATLKEAVAAAAEGSTLQLKGALKETLTVTKSLTLDLNGFSIDGILTAEDCTLTVKDSTTDDFLVGSGYGVVNAKGNVQAAEGYVAIREKNGTSYHRLDLKLGTVNLRPAAVGIYYRGNFGGDEAVKAYVKTYGTALSLSGTPSQSEITTDRHYSSHTAFSPDSWVCGETGKANGTLLKDIMKKTNSAAVNSHNAEFDIFGVAYVQLKDGTVVLGEPVKMSLRDVVEAADALWDTLDTRQIQSMQTLYETYEPTMEGWNIPNLIRSLSYEVTFLDHDGKVLKLQYVRPGKGATAPADPVRDGYTFLGWDQSFSNITGDLTVRAMYEKKPVQTYTVKFVNYNGQLLETQTVDAGGDAKLPANPTKSGCTFLGWTGNYANVKKDEIVRAVYSDEKNVIRVHSATAGPGGTVTVLVEITGQVKTCCFDFDIFYDPDLELVSFNNDLDLDVIFNKTAYENGSALNFAATADKTKQRDIVEITFRVNGTAGDKLPITLVMDSIKELDSKDKYVDTKYVLINGCISVG